VESKELSVPQDSTVDELSQLGPISPELVLVDPELAARARALPDRQPWRVARSEQPPDTVPLDVGAAAQTARLVTNATLIEQLSEDRIAAEPDEWQYGSARRRRWPQVTGAVVVVCAAAAAAFLLAGRSATTGPSREAGPDGTVSSAAATEQQATQGERVASSASRPGRTASDGRANTAGNSDPPTKREREASVTEKPKAHVAGRRTTHRRPRVTRPTPRPRTTAPRPSNVLGVVASTQGGAVTLRWQPPRGAVGVLIRRRPGRGADETTVYEGARKVYVDRTVREGVVYRYSLVTKGKRGTRSKGVAVFVTPRA
jgi:hypothetical protein